MLVIRLYNEKRLDMKTTEIIGLDFRLEETLSSIIKIERGPNFHIMRKKVNLLTSFLPDKNYALFAVSCLPLHSVIGPDLGKES